MNIAILTNTSEKIKSLSEVTLGNKIGYAEKHGYKVYCSVFDYENYNTFIVGLMRANLDMLKSHDAVMVMGADTMFMNWNIRIEDVLKDSDHVVISRERTSWWPLNDDVIILKSTCEVLEFYERLIDDFEIWKHYPWRLQTHLWNLIQEDSGVAKLIRLVEPPVMNQHASRWQLGDWVVHMYDMPIDDKVKQARIFAEKWPDGQPVWKFKVETQRPMVN